MLKSPLFGLDDEDLIQLASGRQKNESLWRALHDRAPATPRHAEALALLREIRALADQRPP